MCFCVFGSTPVIPSLLPGLVNPFRTLVRSIVVRMPSRSADQMVDVLVYGLAVAHVFASAFRTIVHPGYYSLHFVCISLVVPSIASPYLGCYDAPPLDPARPVAHFFLPTCITWLSAVLSGLPHLQVPTLFILLLCLRTPLYSTPKSRFSDSLTVVFFFVSPLTPFLFLFQILWLTACFRVLTAVLTVSAFSSHDCFLVPPPSFSLAALLLTCCSAREYMPPH